MDDAELWQRFSSQDLAHAEWNHVAHVRTAYLHVARWPIDEAHLRMRAGIIRLNQRHGLVEGPERGYFETLTRVWLLLVQAAARRCVPPPSSSLDLLVRRPELLERTLPLTHYSRELLAGTRARAIFVEPDLLPLPG
jgi:hypothetical protein